MRTSSSPVLALAAALLAAGAAAQVPPVSPIDPAQTLMPPSPTGEPGVRWTRAQLQWSFLVADNNRNGQLTRAEAQALPILPHSFEDMDEDKDGLLQPDEYYDYGWGGR